MRIILSRKGFDSQYGKQASPILPDGTMLSLPIPSDNDYFTYSDIMWKGQNYLEIIHSLNPRSVINEHSHCHLDPDLRNESIKRKGSWRPAFGQTSSSLTELRKYGVSVGDIFLFFGWFKETEYRDGGIHYEYHARNLHVIYGYMQIGDIVEQIEAIPEWLQYHPHADIKNYGEAWKRRQNAIFLPSKQLSIAPNLPGCGTFQYDKRYVLTKDGCSRSRWALPESMRGVAISHNPNGWKKDYFQSATRGQEFVIPDHPTVLEWVKYLFSIDF